MKISCSACALNGERPLVGGPLVWPRAVCFRVRRLFIAFSRPGSDLLSRVLRRSTIGAGAFHGRVRKGNGCSHPAITTRSAKGNEPTFLLVFVEKLVFLVHRLCFVLTRVPQPAGCCAADGPPNAWRRPLTCMAALLDVEHGSHTVGDGLFEHVMASSSRLAALDEHGQ